MYSTIKQTKHLLPLQRAWCRLECGHDVLLNISDASPWPSIGLRVDCPRCSLVPFSGMTSGKLYAVFFKSDPTAPVLLEFVTYRLAQFYACFRGPVPDERVFWTDYSFVAAIEEA